MEEGIKYKITVVKLIPKVDVGSGYDRERSEDVYEQTVTEIDLKEVIRVINKIPSPLYPFDDK